MFSTSGDILNLVLSVSVIVLTSFLCVALFYLISSVSKAHRVIKKIEGGVVKAEEVISLIREKIKNGGAYLMLLGEIAKKAMEYFFDKSRENKEEKVKGKKTKK